MTNPESNTDRQASAQPKRRPRRKAPFGKAALFSVLSLWLAFLLTSTTPIVSWQVSDSLRSLAGYASFGVGIVLSIVSLVKREPRAYGIVTLCLVVASPLLFMALAMLVWIGYSMSMQ